MLQTYFVSCDIQKLFFYDNTFLICNLYALGNSYTQIAEHIEDIYCVEFSKATISAVTDKVIPMLQEWRTRPLEAVYPFVFLDAIHYKVKENGRYIAKAFYTVPSGEKILDQVRGEIFNII